MELQKNRLIPILIGVLGWLVYYVFFRYEYSPEVKIHTGSIRGFLSKSRLGNEYYKFLGVPYAKPPERFQPPEELVESWEGVRNAIHFGQKCIQVDPLSRRILGGEDCLFLNVFVPKDVLVNKKNVPVIVYIHGGYFMTGASDFMGPSYLMDEDVIFVSVNYRMNAFGFLNTGDGAIKGNMGLKDQHMALKWVQKNIGHFGGDKTRVTLAGQSAGSASVHFHLLSPLSKGLFARAIMSSGTAIKPWSLVSNPGEQAKHLADFLKCPTDSSQKMVSCLKSQDASKIVEAHQNALDTPVMNPLIMFAPTIESPDDPTAFVPYHPYDILTAGNASKVPLLTGINSEEGLISTGRILANATIKQQVETSWNDMSPNFLFYDKSRKDLTAKIRQFYLKDSSNGKISFDDKFQNITNAFSDRLYFHATRETVKIQSKYSHVYLYYFTYPLKRSLAYFYDINHKLPLVPQFIYKEVRSLINEYILEEDSSLGVSHGDDIGLVFKFPAIYLNPGAPDYEMSRLMVKLWVDFAHNPKSLTINGKPWSPISFSDEKPLKYMSISGSECHTSLIEEPFSERMKFWDDLNLPWKDMRASYK